MATESNINKALIEDVLAIYMQAELEMLEKVAKRTKKGIKQEGWNEQMLKETQELNKQLKEVLGDATKLAKANVSKGILDAYKDGVDSVNQDKGMHRTILDELDIPANVKQLVLATNKLLNNTTFQVLRNADDSYRQIMANSATGVVAGTDTRIQATQKMLNEFADKGITSFVDKAGRNWNLSSYAEMCMRTVSAQATLQGHIDRQLEVGEDLMKVSSIGTTCPICGPWQGVVLSITGNTKGYHTIEDAKAAGVFHPNCKHTLNLFIPSLDGKAKTEPSPIPNKAMDERYNLIQKQRSNERNIRYWKRREALAITDVDKMMCRNKIKYWQQKQLLHCTKNNLRRDYAREGNMQGYKEGKKGAIIGGRLPEYEELFKDVIGENPKSVFNNFNLQLFGHKKVVYEKWLKDEIKNLDEYDIDVAQLKDKNNKSVTLTTMYKKYIGDNPSADYAEVTEYEKGTKEYKTGYAKWLKEQVEDIGIGYKVKPQFKEIIKNVDEADKTLSATEIYKKYHDGKKPTEAYKELGGEEGTGMKYGKWVETQKKELIKNGIKVKVPFENATVNQSSKVISEANKSIQEAKKGPEESSKPKQKPIPAPKPKDEDSKYQLLMQKYEKEYKTPAQVSVGLKKLAKEKEAINQKKKETGLFDSKAFSDIEFKEDALKRYDLKLLKEIIEKSDYEKALYEIDWLTDNVMDNPNIDAKVKDHVKKKIKLWEQMEGLDDYIKKQNEKAKAKQEASSTEKYKKVSSTKVDDLDLDFDSFYDKKEASKVDTYNNKVFNDENLVDMANEINSMIHHNQTMKKSGLYDSDEIQIHTKKAFDLWKENADRSEFKAMRTYTGSAYKPINMHLRGIEEASIDMQMVIEDLKSGFAKAELVQDIGLRRGVDAEGASYFLGGDGTSKWIREHVDELNKGQTIVRDMGVMSTTPFEGKGFDDNCDVRILARKGTRGLHVESISNFEGERETVLAPGTAFRVVQVAPNPEYQHKFVIYVESVPILSKYNY